MEETLSEKLQIINEIYRSYIEKDISFLLRVERIDAFGSMIRLLAGQTGNILNLNEVVLDAGDIGANRKELSFLCGKDLCHTEGLPVFQKSEERDQQVAGRVFSGSRP
ncbi:MAG: hypothetical protein M0C28_05015 [Candidatus Moduliflexus flocculans]|nr:hypothetical protein [Candidatus Moduliflexus flocculans]